MKNVKELLDEVTDVQQFTRGYCDYLSHLLSQVDGQAVASFLSELEAARNEQNTVFVIGNGGSATTASHLVNDLSLGSRTQDEDLPFRLMSLTDNIACLTALANDCGYDNIFVRKLEVYYKPGDKLLAISASGNSPNVIKAVEWVKEKEGKVLSFAGFDGGKLRGLSDVCICVEAPKGEYGPVEDVHMILDHLLYTWLWYKKRGMN